MDIRLQSQSDANALREQIQSFLEERRISVPKFARIAGLPAATIQNIRKPSWSPSFSVLQACITAVRREEAERQLTVSPVEYDLPTMHLKRECNALFKRCWEAWQQNDMLANQELIGAIESAGLGARMSLLHAGDDNRIWLARFGPAVFGETPLVGRHLADLPDRSFGAWIEERVWRVLSGGLPVFASCEVTMATVVGTHRVPYTTLRLPLKKSRASPWFDAAVTVSLLSESSYRNAISGALGR